MEHTVQHNGLDTAGVASTLTSFGGAIAGTIAPHPLQMIAWGAAIAAGFASLLLAAVRVYFIIREHNRATRGK